MQKEGLCFPVLECLTSGLQQCGWLLHCLASAAPELCNFNQSQLLQCVAKGKYLVTSSFQVADFVVTGTSGNSSQAALDHRYPSSSVSQAPQKILCHSASQWLCLPHLQGLLLSPGGGRNFRGSLSALRVVIASYVCYSYTFQSSLYVLLANTSLFQSFIIVNNSLY